MGGVFTLNSVGFPTTLSAYPLQQGSSGKAVVVCRSNMSAYLLKAAILTPGYDCNFSIAPSRFYHLIPGYHLTKITLLWGPCCIVLYRSCRRGKAYVVTYVEAENCNNNNRNNVEYKYEEYMSHERTQWTVLASQRHHRINQWQRPFCVLEKQHLLLCGSID